jgi:hypothetical protein
MAKPRTIANLVSENNIKEDKVLSKEEVKETKRIKIAGNAIVLTSKLKLDTIKKLEKYVPNALVLVSTEKDEETEIFRIATGKVGSVSKYGISFATADKNGFATITTNIPEDVTDKKEYVKDNYATILLMLKDIEAVANTTLAEFEADYEKLDEEIEEV